MKDKGNILFTMKRIKVFFYSESNHRMDVEDNSRALYISEEKGNNHICSHIRESRSLEAVSFIWKYFAVELL